MLLHHASVTRFAQDALLHHCNKGISCCPLWWLKMVCPVMFRCRDYHFVTLWLVAGSCSWYQAMPLPSSAQEEQLPNGRPWLGEQHATDDHSGDEAPVNDGLQSSGARCGNSAVLDVHARCCAVSSLGHSMRCSACSLACTGPWAWS